MRIFYPHRGIRGPGKKMMKKYDQITMTRKVPAIGGIDAHSRILNKRLNLLRYPKYLTLFRNFRNHIISKREFILCGASAIAIGTGNFINPLAPSEIVEGLEKYLEKIKLNSIQGLIGSLIV